VIGTVLGSAIGNIFFLKKYEIAIWQILLCLETLYNYRFCKLLDEITDFLKKKLKEDEILGRQIGNLPTFTIFQKPKIVN